MRLTMSFSKASIDSSAANTGIYASVAGGYILGERISRHQYFLNQQ